MTAKSILLFSAALLMLTAPAGAADQQREYQPGLNFTAFNPKLMKKTEDAANETPLTPTAPTRPALPIAKAPTPIKPQVPGSAEEQQDTQTRIWNKYKALAAGQAEPSDQTKQQPDAPQSPSPTLEHMAPAAGTDQPSPATASQTQPMKTWSAPPSQLEQFKKEDTQKQTSGIASLLQEWKASKSQQREMRSLRFAAPPQNAQPENSGTQNAP